MKETHNTALWSLPANVLHSFVSVSLQDESIPTHTHRYMHVCVCVTVCAQTALSRTPHCDLAQFLKRMPFLMQPSSLGLWQRVDFISCVAGRRFTSQTFFPW